MSKPLIIGITGGIGGGKSTFSHHLRQYGEMVYDSDSEARRLQNSNKEVIKAIKSEFGNDIYTEKNELNRKALGEIVFSNPKKLEILNHIVHPAVKEDFSHWIKKHNTCSYLFMESAILYEANFDTIVDKVIVISAPLEVRIKRVMQRDKLDEKAVLARINNQIDEKIKIEKADWYYDTDNNLSPDKRVKLFLEKLKCL